MLRLLALLFVLSAVLPKCSGASAEGVLSGVPTTIVVGNVGELHSALRQVREWRRTGDARCRHGVTIAVRAGRYYMAEPLFLRPEDSGTAEAPTVIRGEQGTVLCGDPRQRHVQVWPREGMGRLLDFDVEKRTMSIATPPQMPPLARREEMSRLGSSMEMVVCQRWAMAILRVKAMEARGDSCVVTFEEPESRLEFDHPWPQPVIGGPKGSSAYMLRTTEQRDGVEKLVVVGGADGHRVSHISFENISFENTCWNRPLHHGHVTLQGGLPLIDAYKLKENEGLPWDPGLENQAWVERPVAAVSVSSATHIAFSHCSFSKTGATALDFVDDTDSCTVSHCTFTDIGGTAVMAGSFAESPREVHRPYADLAQRCRHLTVSDCHIDGAATEDWGAVGIGCGYVSDATISGNSVARVNYSGICVGWGWTAMPTGMERNSICGNTVTAYALQLYDAGGIYTLSNQPGSTISGNTIGVPGPAPYATNDRAFRIYLDARTDGYTVSGNRDERGNTIGEGDIGYNQPGKALVVE